MTVAPPAGTASTEAVPQHRTLVWPVLAGVAVLAGCTAAGIGTLSLASALTATGLPDPGPVTTLGLPFLRAAGEIAAVLAVGSFLFAAFLVPPQPSGVLDADGYRALRLGTVASGVWAVCAALLVPLTLSDVSGHPVADLRPAQMWSLAGLITTASAWRWTAILAAATTLASLPVLRWSWAPVLLAASLTTLIPLGLTGHSSAGGSHDLATNGLLIHLVAAALWAGGLLALLAYALRGGQGGGHLGLATRRFSTIALWCWVAMALSGLVNAAVRVQPSDLLATGYGRLVLAKAAALCLLGGVGWRQRRVNVAALQAVSTLARARRALLRLTLIEAALFGLTFGIAVGLGRTAPPPPPARLPSIAEAEIGYDFDGPPTLTRILFDWRFDLIFGTAAIVLAGLYVAGVVRLRRRGDRWPPAACRPGCSAAWCCCSSRRRGSAATCRPCSACTWWCTCACPCWCRSCWRWAPRSPWRYARCPPPAAAIRRDRVNGCWPRCTAGSPGCSPTPWWPPCCSWPVSTGCICPTCSTPPRAVMPGTC
ncbi:copper resistance D family protein [Mycobacterium avium subsp. avium 2285 (R)]|nr:copper resistance D family protein [Mycobacterium avium subsp. avium 2285 (R)]